MFKRLATLIEKRLQRYQFELVKTFEVTVPVDYDHATRLTKFGKAHCEEFYYYSDAITDTNFAKTPALTPGKKFLVKVFQIHGIVSSEDCLTQLRCVKATLTGAHGASLVYEQAKNELPEGSWALSFDEKRNLPFIDDDYRVPCVNAFTVCDFKWYLDYFESHWGDHYVILAFCDIST